MFFITWVVLFLVMILFAIYLSTPSSSNHQQVINQYIARDKGLSAYDVAIKNGFNGTETEWLSSLKGENAESTNTVVEKQTEYQTKVIEQVPVNGMSSYDIWVSLGNIGTQQDYINSLKGATGQTLSLDIRFNNDIGLFQTKRSTDTFWKTVANCGGTTGKVCN